MGLVLFIVAVGVMLASSPSTFELGRRAEQIATEWLKTKGFQIVTRNWRTRFHEIDIIARKANRIHFIEVKYRRSRRHGAPEEYVTHQKLNRVMAAAYAWLNQEGFAHAGIQIDVIAIYGWPKPQKLEYLPNVSSDY